MKPRQLLAVVGLCLFAVAIVASVIGWMTADPRTKAGRLRRGLDAVSNETEKREQEIQELTNP